MDEGGTGSQPSLASSPNVPADVAAQRDFIDSSSDAISDWDAQTTPAQLAKSFVDSIGEAQLRLEQPKASYADKKQLLLDLSESILGSDRGGAEAGSDNRGPGNLRVIREKLARSLITDQQVRFIGEPIASTGELVLKAQALRNPRFETFYLLPVRTENGKRIIAGAMAITSRLPGSTPISTEDSFADAISEHLAILKATNADGYYLLHNHPSGDATPSRADIAVTIHHAKAMEEAGIPMLAHIVINHRTFSSIDSWGSPSIGSLDNTGTADPYGFPAKYALGDKVSNPETILLVGKSLEAERGNPENIIGFFVNSRLKIVATTVASKEDFQNLTDKEIKDYAVSQGAVKLMLHAKANGREEAIKLAAKLKPKNEDSLIYEIVIDLDPSTHTYFSGIEEGGWNMPLGFFNEPEKHYGTRVQEDGQLPKVSPEQQKKRTGSQPSLASSLPPNADLKNLIKT